jgi:hypothetical protein
MISCISFRVGRTKALPRRRVAGHELFSTTNRHCGVAPCAHFATVEGSWNEQREQRLGNLCVECPSLNGADNMQAAFADAGYPCKTIVLVQASASLRPGGSAAAQNVPDKEIVRGGVSVSSIAFAGSSVLKAWHGFLAAVG